MVSETLVGVMNLTLMTLNPFVDTLSVKLISLGVVYWVWVMGVGEIVEMDSRGRITIPANIRKIIGKSKFRVELVGKDTIVLKAVKNKREIVKRISSIKLVGDKERASVDAATVKDFYGGVKY